MPKPRHLSKTATTTWERIDAIIRQRFVGAHMSKAKWVKLLQAAAAFADRVPRMNYKLVHGPEVRHVHTPLHPESVDPEWIQEPFFYKEVEWLEFPFTVEYATNAGLKPRVVEQDIVSLQHHLEGIANFPLVRTESGLRVVAYAEA